MWHHIFANVKKAISIFTAFVILLGSMSNALLVAEFKLNQAEIERLYCVNKSKPEKHCHGKCHLNKQLAENNSHQSSPTPKSQMEDAFKINFFHQQDLSKPEFISTDEYNPIPVRYSVFNSRLFGNSMFQPPDIQALS